jgi:hypothetical protein
MADKIDAQILKVIGCQLAHDHGIDRVIAKRLFVLLHPEVAKPSCDIHARLSCAVLAASRNFTAICHGGLMLSAAPRYITAKQRDPALLVASATRAGTPTGSRTTSALNLDVRGLTEGELGAGDRDSEECARVLKSRTGQNATASV